MLRWNFARILLERTATFWVLALLALGALLYATVAEPVDAGRLLAGGAADGFGWD